MWSRRALIGAMVLGGVVFSFSTAAGQVGGPKVETPLRGTGSADRRATNIRMNVKVALVPVTVSDALNRPITGLPQERFRLLEDGIEQRITSFCVEDGPVSLGLLFDSSGSMKNRIGASVEALKYVFQASTPGDEYFLIEFNDRPQFLSGFSANPEDIHERLGLVRPKGWTALLDAVALGTNKMKAARNRRKALLVLSDGNDNNSRFNESEVKSMVMEGDVLVYSICLNYRPRILERLAEETGGKVLVARTVRELPEVVQRLGTEIRSHYVLGYSPQNPQNDGKYRRVKVEVIQEPGVAALHASWRRGYYAPRE